MAQSIARPALILGLLSCIGPFAIDMYLPAMPAIGSDLGTSMQVMQGTITAYFVSMGVAQLIYGPWSDQVGRKCRCMPASRSLRWARCGASLRPRGMIC